MINKELSTIRALTPRSAPAPNEPTPGDRSNASTSVLDSAGDRRRLTLGDSVRVEKPIWISSAPTSNRRVRGLRYQSMFLAQLPSWEDLILGHDCPYTLAAAAFVLQALVFGTLSAYSAVHRGLVPGRWFAAGFFASFVGFIWVRTKAPVAGRFGPRRFGKTPTTHDPRPCAGCGRSLHPSCDRCPACGAEIIGEHPPSEVRLAKQSRPTGLGG